MPLWDVTVSDLAAELRPLLLELGLLTADAAMCAVLVSAARAVGRAVGRVRDASVFEADAELADCVAAAGGRLEFAAVRGVVRPLAEPIAARANPSLLGVLQRLSLQEYTMDASGATGFWSERRTLHQAVNVVPFALCGSQLHVTVQQSDCLVADLYTVRDEYLPTESTLAQSVWQWLLGERKQGMRDVEELLLVETRATGYGELALTEHGLELQPPAELPYILTTRSKAALLREMCAERRALRLVLVALVWAAVVGSVWTGRQLWVGLAARARRRRLAAQYDQIRTERRRRERAGGQVAEAVQCVVCLTNPREVVVSPCQHVCLCVDCEERLPKRCCPICRHEVAAVLPVYLA